MFWSHECKNIYVPAFTLGGESEHPEVELINHMVLLFLTFMNCHTILYHKWLYHYTMPPAVHNGSNFSTFPPILVIILYTSYPNGWGVVFCCCFDLHYPTY